MKPKIERMFSGIRQHHKFDIATGQLETAIRLFLVDGCDMFSSVTLAAAAGEILHRLVLNAGKRPFVDDVARIGQLENPAQTEKRSSIISHIHRILRINELKHLDEKQAELVEFDVEESAIAAILKAMIDYHTLTGEHTATMKAFLGWTYQNPGKFRATGSTANTGEIMAKIEVFNIERYNVVTDSYDRSPKMTTRKRAGELFCSIVEGSGTIVDSSSLDDREMFTPEKGDISGS